MDLLELAKELDELRAENAELKYWRKADCSMAAVIGCAVGVVVMGLFLLGW